jgi:predicted peptidase
MIDALRQAGAEPKLTIYPDVGHECWGLAYDAPETWDWLLKQKRPAAKQ